MNKTRVDDMLIEMIKPKIEEIEQKAIDEIDKLSIEDSFYKEKLTILKVYIQLALLQLENEAMNEKYKSYKKEFEYYYALAKNSNKPSNLKTATINRS